ncbi:hypothetical protein BGZ49_000975 [Haplosporangium sp. Z 27]|nr:hypothetical protein BGZ49_000975 [Haplosporangium sp. Z 27]
MNRDREPTQVIDPTSSPSPSPLATEELSGLSKIKATALLLKQKVAGTNTKPQKVPSKISHPWSLSSSSSRSHSFSSPISPYSTNTGSSLASSVGTSNSSSRREGHATVGAAGLKKDGIKAMIAAREDPSLSCNKMAPPGTQPAPAPQKRDIRAGMTKVQLSPQTSTPISPQETKTKDQLDQGEQPLNRPSIDREPQVERQQDQSPQGVNTIVSKNAAESSNTDLSKRSTRRRNAGNEALIPSQFAAPSQSPTTPLFMQAFQNPDLTIPAPSTSTNTATTAVDTNLSNTRSKRNTERYYNMDADKIDNSLSTKDQKSLLASSPTTIQSNSDSSNKVKTESKRNSASSSKKATSATSSTSSKTSELDRRPSAPRRHTTSNSQDSSSSFFSSHDAPPVPKIKSHVNPTLRQIQTPQIPTNLVQARIMQREEQKRMQEELAKIPITANLRTVKKIQAVVLDDDDDEKKEINSNNCPKGDNTEGSSSLFPPSIPSGYSSLGVASGSSRPRAKTTTSSTVTVSTLMGGKQRGDRNHVEPVVIPKKLAEQVEHILGRKLAGKGNVLDEREKEREEEEARKAAEPLPPIVRGQPRKRALTSTHIRNLVSSWDHKVEEAKEITSEAEQIRQFLEQRSTAQAELPKFSKVQLSGSELLKPLPSLPPPPPTNGNKAPKQVGGHTKAASSASPYMSSRHFGSTSLSTPSLRVEDTSASTTQDVTVDVITSSVATEEAEVTVMTTETTPKIVLDAAPDDQSIEANETAPETSSKPSFSLEQLETKRSGQVLDNKALKSRPRRAGVRKPTLTQAEA